MVRATVTALACALERRRRQREGKRKERAARTDSGKGSVGWLAPVRSGRARSVRLGLG